ncbi:3',5'-cyclic-nucleotide phosphodiesterase [bacterium]|nr:3',5'-cyclic-nucleotide phosphodiesterase [bacterium]
MLSILPLGCYGSDLENKKCISMQLTPSTVIDTGSLMSSLDIPQLLEVQNIILTHSHFDHIKNLPIFADFKLSLGSNSFTVYTTETIMNQVKEHIFNDLIWPDFTKLPNSKKPTIRFQPIEFDKPFTLDGIEIIPIRVAHVVESLGFIFRKDGKAVAYSGDTGVCDDFVNYINDMPEVKTICWESSFPNRLERLAVVSKHLTPSMLGHELEKINRLCSVYTFHLKPNLENEIVMDLKSIQTKMKITPMRQKRPIIAE